MAATRRHRGSLLLEAIVAIGIFAIFLGGIGLSLIAGERSTISGGDRARAGFRAEEQLSAVRQMQKNDFSLLTEGTHGIKLQGGLWSFSGAFVIQNGYTSFIKLKENDESQIQAISTVSWNFGQGRSGSVVLTTMLTDWQAPLTVGNWAVATLKGEVAQSGSPNFEDVAVSGQYAFVASTVAPGLFVYDISTSTPVRVSSSLDIGAGAYALTVSGNRLYAATNDATREVQVFDITDPTTLTLSSRINEYNMTSGGGRSIAVYGETIFLGTANDGVNPQFFSLLMSETGPIELLGSLSVSGSVLGISLNSGYALLGTDSNSAELLVVDVIDPENLQYAPGTGIDMTDTQDALSIVTSGTSALIGRANGSAIDELTLYDIGLSPVPSPPPGPWTLEVGGDAAALAVIDGTKYGFVAGSAASAELRIIDLLALQKSGTVILKTINAGATLRGLAYDWPTDRLFAVSATALKVYAP